jgi:hypothetical protein
VEAVRQGMEKKAPDELRGVERHHFGGAGMAIILPGEADLAVFECEQPAVGDGDAMGVAAEIGERLARAAERRLGVDHPIDAAQFGDTRVESGVVGEARERTGEAQPAGVIGVLQVAQKEPAEQARENPHRQEEGGAAGDPARAIERGAAAGHDAMDMRVMAPTPTIP